MSEAVIRLEISVVAPELLAANFPLISRLFLFLSGQITVKPAEALIAAHCGSYWLRDWEKPNDRTTRSRPEMLTSAVPLPVITSCLWPPSSPALPSPHLSSPSSYHLPSSWPRGAVSSGASNHQLGVYWCCFSESVSSSSVDPRLSQSKHLSWLPAYHCSKSSPTNDKGWQFVRNHLQQQLALSQEREIQD